MAGFQVDCRHVRVEFLRPSDGVTKSVKIQPNQLVMGLNSTLELYLNEASRRDSSDTVIRHSPVLKCGPWRLPANRRPTSAVFFSNNQGLQFLERRKRTDTFKLIKNKSDPPVIHKGIGEDSDCRATVRGSGERPS